MEYKSLGMFEPVEISDRIVTGFVSVMGNIDDGRDMILNGAFDRSIKNFVRVKHLWMHDTSKPPIAKILEIREVGKDFLPTSFLEATPDATGALMVKREYLKHEFADQVLNGIQQNVITESSIGFDVNQFEITLDKNGKPYRVLKELKLWDTSDVLWGMNSATTNLKAYPNLFDAKEGRVLSAGNFDKLRSAMQAIQEVIDSASNSGKSLDIGGQFDLQSLIQWQSDRAKQVKLWEGK